MFDMMFVDPCVIVQFIKKNPTRCNNVSKFYYSIFIWSSTCFGRHTVHRQEPKTALAASGFSYVEGCWTCSWWTLSGTDTVPDKGTPHIQLLNIKWNKNSSYLPYEPSFSLSICRRCYLPCSLAHTICICLNCKYATPYSINT